MTAARSRIDSSSGESARTLTALDIATVVGGELVGAGDARVFRVAPVDRAGPGELTFLANPKYAAALAHAAAEVVLVSPELAETPGPVKARVIVPKPQEAVLEVLPLLYTQAARTPGVHPTVQIGRGARIGSEAALGPHVVIGDGATIGDRVSLDAGVVVGTGVRLGDDVHLYPGVTIYPGTFLGDRVIVHAGARLGCDGFGYVFKDGAHRKLPHVGRCLIEQDVEIGANTTIDRGSIDDTVVGSGTKIDNLVQVGHNVKIGRLCLLMSQVGVAGSVRIGDGCILAGQVGVSGHLTIGAGARLAAQAGVFGDIPAGETWSGYPARPHREALRASAALFKLAGLLKRLERLLERE